MYKLAESRGPSPFGARLRALRRWRGLTQVDLMEKCGISSMQISHYETGVKQNASAHNLTRLASALGTSVDYLLRGIEDP